jgi:hypothetical protein
MSVRSLPAAVVLCLLAFAAPAAGMEVAMQDDLAVVHGYSSRNLALRQFRAMGGTSVRINLFHRREPRFRNNPRAGAVAPALHMYDSGVQDVVDHGLKAQITLVWREQADPKRIARWARNAAEHFGDKVNRYSILNEPDLLLPIGSACNAAGQRRLVRRFPRKMLYQGDGEIRPKVLTLQRGMNLRTGCERYERGRRYRPIARAAAKAIRAGNPDAQVLVGETSAQPGLEWFIRGLQPRDLDVDGYAHHPFQLHDLTPQREANGWGIGNFNQLRRLIRMPLYFTEFGYPHPNSTMDKRTMGRRLKWHEVAAALTRAWSIAHRKGAKQMMQYQWFRKPKWRHEYWETAINNRDDGRTTPAYRALRRLILSW